MSLAGCPKLSHEVPVAKVSASLTRNVRLKVCYVLLMLSRRMQRSVSSAAILVCRALAFQRLGVQLPARAQVKRYFAVGVIPTRGRCNADNLLSRWTPCALAERDQPYQHVLGDFVHDEEQRTGQPDIWSLFGVKSIARGACEAEIAVWHPEVNRGRSHFWTTWERRTGFVCCVRFSEHRRGFIERTPMSVKSEVPIKPNKMPGITLRQFAVLREAFLKVQRRLQTSNWPKERRPRRRHNRCRKGRDQNRTHIANRREIDKIAHHAPLAQPV